MKTKKGIYNGVVTNDFVYMVTMAQGCYVLTLGNTLSHLHQTQKHLSQSYKGLLDNYISERFLWKIKVSEKMDLFASNIGIMLKYFCSFTIIIAMLSMLFVCVLHFVFYVNPNLIRTCDRGENCRRRKQAYKEHVIKRNNATNTIIYDLRKNGIQSNDSLPEPLFLEHLI